jgi:hypothetical protein
LLKATPPLTPLFDAELEAAPPTTDVWSPQTAFVPSTILETLSPASPPPAKPRPAHALE